MPFCAHTCGPSIDCHCFLLPRVAYGSGSQESWYHRTYILVRMILITSQLKISIHISIDKYGHELPLSIRAG